MRKIVKVFRVYLDFQEVSSRFSGLFCFSSQFVETSRLKAEISYYKPERGDNMVQANSMVLDSETIQKYVETIRHFRGYVDKERFAEDVEFLRRFLERAEIPVEDRKAA